MESFARITDGFSGKLIRTINSFVRPTASKSQPALNPNSTKALPKLTLAGIRYAPRWRHGIGIVDIQDNRRAPRGAECLRNGNRQGHNILYRPALAGFYTSNPRECARYKLIYRDIDKARILEIADTISVGVREPGGAPNRFTQPQSDGPTGP